MEHMSIPYDNYNNKNQINQLITTRGHIRSASLENANSFILKNTLGLPLIGPGTTGTLKSRNEQKRLKNRFGSHNNLEDYVAQSKSKFQNLRNMFETKLDYEQQQQQQQQPQQHQLQHHLMSPPPPPHNHHFNQLNSIIKINPPSHLHHQHHQQQQLQQLQQHQQQQHLQHQQQQQQQQQHHHHHSLQHLQHNHQQTTIEFNESLSIVEADRIVGHTNNNNNNNNNNNLNNHHNHHQSNNCTETVEQTKNLLRPIAFKPIPFEPDYSIPNRYSDLCDRYGSTPSLAPIQGPNMKFGSTSDLRHSYNSYCSNLMARRRCSRSLKINDSMESVRHTPDSDANSQNSTIKSSNKFHQDQFDMTPSPSDSGISELEAALKDRDSELSYLRQTMEHNEKVIFKVHKDKEAYWEQETKRLKIFYESQQREYLLKIKKMEQMLTLQSFQFKQNKLRLSENSNRIQEQFSDLKNENELLRIETDSLKTTERTMRDRVNQLEEKINVMDKLIINLKSQLEENEWTVCEKNGEIALLKTQLKEATVELTLKEHEIVHIKTEHQSEVQNQTENLISGPTSVEIEDNHSLEVSQLNRIITLKDQVILALTNELGKLRKELSDLEIFHEYGEEPSGKYSRLKYKIDNLTGICNPTKIDNNEINDDNDDNDDDDDKDKTKHLKNDKLITQKEIEENDLEIIINCLKSNNKNDNDDLIENFNNLQNHINLPDVTQIGELTASIDCVDNSNENDENDDDNDNNDYKILIANDQNNSCLKKELDEARKSFEYEKLQWCEEKEKVLKYQRQLQMHYINMYQKMKELENQVVAQKKL